MKNHGSKRIFSPLIAALLCVMLLFSCSAAVSASTLFKDVPYTSWYYFYVKYDIDKAVMSGTSKTTFSPRQAMSRAMTVKTVHNLAGQPGYSLEGGEGEEAWAGFYDVPAGSWYEDAVYWAWSRGIAAGVGENRFAPNAPVTREEFAAFLYRYEADLFEQWMKAESEGEESAAAAAAETETTEETDEAAAANAAAAEESSEEEAAMAAAPSAFSFEETYVPGDLSRFGDEAAISDWARTPLAWAVGQGLFVGNDKGELEPGKYMTRAEAAAVLARYHGITPAYIESVRIAPIKITVSAVGDCTLGTDKNFAYSTSFPAMMDKVKDPAYFFSNVYGVLSKDDLTIVNLEGTLTKQTARADKTFAFKGDPSYAKILVAGSVEAANLANNHSHDYGLQSYYDTIKNTEAVGIPTFGYERSAVLNVKGVRVGLVGIYELSAHMGCKTQLLQQIKAVRNKGADVVIVSFHWGVERENYPTKTQKQLAHLAVDNGADLVLGHHPHVLQGIEVYKGKNIVYSLANFCFGGNKNPADKDTMIFQQTFTLLDDEIVKDNVKKVIPCRVSSVTSRNDYRPTILTGSEGQRVLNRINTYSKGL